jgi:hypothetical protein
MPLPAPVIRAAPALQVHDHPVTDSSLPDGAGVRPGGAAGPHQNDRSPPVSWLVRKLAKKNPK